MARSKSTDENTSTEIFDVRNTDKRNSKRVLLDYVGVKAFAPEQIDELFDPETVELIEADLAAIAGIEDAVTPTTPVHTALAAYLADVERRRATEYADFEYKAESGVHFFKPKNKRGPARSKAEKAADQVVSMSQEDEAEFLKALAARGLSVVQVPVEETDAE